MDEFKFFKTFKERGEWVEARFMADAMRHGYKVLFLAAIIALAIQNFIRSRQIDSTWEEWWFRYIAEQLERTASGEWLRMAGQAVEKGKIRPRDLVDLLPKLSTVGAIYSYDDSSRLLKN
jgi:hypothetical protein